MRVLVSGASGFLGTSLCKILRSKGASVTELNSSICDLTDQSSLSKYNHIQYDQLIHLAAWTQAGDFCLHHPGEQWVINQKMNTNFLSWWQENQPAAKLIIIGTSCSYAPGNALVEQDYLQGMPIASLFTYAMTKRMLQVGAAAIAQQFGLKFNNFIPSTLYGPGYHTDGRQMHFIFDLIRKILRGKYFDEPVVLWGHGNQRRELVFVDDFSNLMMEIDPLTDNEIINIGSGEEFSIRHFASIISDIVGYNVSDIVYDETKYVGAESKCLDVAKMKKLAPSFRATPLEEGLEMTINWFEQTQAFK